MRILALDLGNEWRGGQRQTHLVVTELHSRRVDICLATLRDSPLFMEASQVPGLKVVPISPGTEASPAVVLDVAGLVKKFRPDVLWAGDSKSHGACVWGRAHHHAPLAVHRRVIFPPKTNLLSRLKYDCVRRFLAVSQSVASVLVRSGIPEDRIRVVPDGLPPDAFVTAPAPPAPPYRLIHAGAFDGRKGQDLCVEVLAGLVNRGKDLTMTFLGEGPERPAVEDLARRLGVLSRCSFKGLVSNVPEELSRSHLLLLPSDSEGAALVLSEALAAGCAALAHDVGGTREMLCDGRAGRLVAGLRLPDWQDAVAELLDTASERLHLIESGRKAAAERTVANTAEILLHEFRKLAAKPEEVA